MVAVPRWARLQARAVLLTVFCVAVFARHVSAQETRKYEVSAGYAYMRADTSAGGLSLHGVDFSLARNLNAWLAMTGDVGGYHAEGFRLGTYMAGPRLTARASDRASLFGQVLFGGAHADAGARDFPSYHDSVAWAFGGGLDYRLNPRISFRFGQVEYLQTRLGSSVQNNLRAGVGIVLHFGAPR
jgi:opacity protein-like surface antigen